MNMGEPIVTWKAEPLRNRLHRCRVMLYLHGFLSDAENARVTKRLHAEEDKQCNAQAMKQQVSA